MSCVGIVILPAIGHINATLKIAKILRKAGNRVIYLSTSGVKSYIINAGFDFFQLDSLPFACGFEYQFARTSKTGFTYIENLKVRSNYTLFEPRKKEFDTFLKDYQASFLLIDSFVSSDCIFFLRHYVDKKVHLVLIQTMLSTSYYLDVPPINVKLSKSRIINYTKGTVHLIINWICMALSFIKYFGYDDLSIIKDKMKLTHIPQIYYPYWNKRFSFGYRNIPELILAPKQLDIESKYRASNEIHIGSFVDLERYEEITPEYLKIKNEMLKFKNIQIMNKIIFCSFGTFKKDNIYTDKIKIIIKYLNRFLRENKNI